MKSLPGVITTRVLVPSSRVTFPTHVESSIAIFMLPESNVFELVTGVAPFRDSSSIVLTPDTSPVTLRTWVVSEAEELETLTVESEDKEALV